MMIKVLENRMTKESIPFGMVDAMLGVIEQVATSPDAPQRWRQYVLQGGMKLINADVGLFIEQSTHPNDHRLRITCEHDLGWLCPERRALFLNHLSQTDGRDRFLALIRQGLLDSDRSFTARREDLIPDAQWRSSPMSHLYETQAGLGPCVASLVKLAAPGCEAGFYLYRHQGRPSFSKGDVRRLDLFQRRIEWIYDQRLPAIVENHRKLPPRLRDVLQCLLAGQSAKQIAVRLKLSNHTIRDYIKDIYRRIGVSSRGELLARCLSNHGTHSHSDDPPPIVPPSQDNKSSSESKPR